ncbi:MAG: hypothetical protein J6X55_06050 [Victivallales bacterium]|nr:hypothetical protein [Victivallales bacterium]
MKIVLSSYIVFTCCICLWAKRTPAPIVPNAMWGNSVISSYFRYINDDRLEVGITFSTSGIKSTIPIFVCLYDTKMERDVQDVYITAIKVNQDIVEIKTERDGVFLYHLEEQKLFCEKIPQGKMLEATEKVFTLVSRKKTN